MRQQEGHIRTGLLRLRTDLVALEQSTPTPPQETVTRPL